MVIFLEDDAIVMRRIRNFFIIFGLFLDLDASTDQHSFHDLA